MSVRRAGWRVSRVLAWSGMAVSAVCFAAIVALDVVNARSIHGPADANVVELILCSTFAVVGGVIALRLPRNATGWLLLLIAVNQAIGGVAAQYAVLGLVTHPGAVPGAQWAMWLYGWVSVLTYPNGFAALTFMVIPTGKLPSSRWRPVVAINLFLAAVLLVFSAFVPGPLSTGNTALPSVNNPAGLDALNLLAGTNNPAPALLYIVGLVVALVSASAPVVRMRRARGDEREQVKWIAYTIIVVTAINLLVIIPSYALPQQLQSPLFWVIPIGLGYGILLPVSIGVSVFKYRLYDIDIIINRTLVYGTLAVVITAVYVGIAVGIGSLVGSGGKPNLGLSILATAIVSVGFQPLRARLQRVANRLVYGKRATPYEVLSAFSSRVSETYVGHELLQRMAILVGEATGAESAGVWLKAGDHLRREAVYPLTAAPRDVVPLNGAADLDIEGATLVAPVRHNEELLGALTVTKRRNEDLTVVERKLVEDLAHQAGLVLRNAGLTAELEARLDELRASRQRLVTAQDDERRRLERNLHDGAQQHLVALKVKLGLAGMTARKNPDGVAPMIEQLQADADEALETLRDLARGIYPPLLADKGLPAALQAQARKATVPVSVEADGVGRYPQDVEAALYFCCLEALQNVQKYAKASHVLIRLRADGAALHAEIEDDGEGFDAAAVNRGAGLTNMEDRIDALGGRLDVDSAPGRGTRLRASLPVS